MRRTYAQKSCEIESQSTEGQILKAPLKGERTLPYSTKTEIMTDLLSKLVRINMDASTGYEYAAEKIENDNFRNFLKSYAERRKRYAAELEKEIVKLGGKAQSDTSLLGEIHQALMKIREAVSTHPDSALLDECVRGEGEAISQYEKVLKTDELKPSTKQLVMTQFDKIRAARSTMEELERVV